MAGKLKKAIQETRDVRAERGDTWFNSRSRFGGSADPVVFSSFQRRRVRIDVEQADALYETDWLAGRVVDQFAKDATSNWIRFTHESNPEIAEKLRV